MRSMLSLISQFWQIFSRIIPPQAWDAVIPQWYFANRERRLGPER